MENTVKITNRRILPAYADDPFAAVVAQMPGFQGAFSGLSDEVRRGAQEIRLRVGRFAVVEAGNAGRVQLNRKVGPDTLGELLRAFCDYSVHSYTRQLCEGYITLRGGHRAGFCGTAVLGADCRVENIRDITSVNIRICRAYKGCADLLYDLLFTRGEDLRGVLILGRPMSAKTTVLRDLVRQIAQNEKVAVIDERGEIAAKSGAGFGMELGENTDVLDGFPKAEGFLTALRALSPSYIACDEIGGDSLSVVRCLNSGVIPIITAHCAGIEEAMRAEGLRDIIQSGAISHMALLGHGNEIGKLKELWKVEQKNGTYTYSGALYRAGGTRGTVSVRKAEAAAADLG